MQTPIIKKNKIKKNKKMLNASALEDDKRWERSNARVVIMKVEHSPVSFHPQIHLMEVN
jgi:hypothetical protein